MTTYLRSHFNIKWLTAASLFTATVLLLSHLPEEAVISPLQVSGIDKVEHVLVYGTITLLFILSLRTSSFFLDASLISLAVLALGVVDELTQAFVNRTTSFSDWTADAVGVGLAIVLSIVFKSRFTRADPNNNGLCGTNHAEGNRAVGLPHSDSIK